MGTIFSRAAKLPRAVLLFALVAVSSLSGLAALSARTATVSADPILTGTGQSMFIVRLPGSSNPQQYTVTAKNVGTGASPTFHYGQGMKGDPSNEFYSDMFGWGGDNSACQNNSSNPANTAKNFSWVFTITKGSTTYGTSTQNYCGTPDKTGTVQIISIAVNDATSTGSGSISGTLAYQAPDGTTQPFRSNTVATLTGPGGTYNLKLTDGGTFGPITVQPGDYTLNATYNASKFDHGELQNGPPYIITANVTVVNGGKSVAAFTVTTKGGTIAGAKLTATGCPNGQSKDGTGACTDNGEDVINCGSGAFNWLVCPVIQLAVKGAQQLDNFIMNTLDIDLGPIFDNTSNKGGSSYAYYTAWNSFRIMGTAILVIAGLVMVSSQALGFEFLDAYTIRKTMPRLLVAIIGLSLSWPLMRFVIGFFDIAGFDIRELIYKPFTQLHSSISVTGGILSTIGAVGAIWALGFTSLTFIVTILTAVFVGFLILLLRQIALVMLIIVAPLAIACYILPNTQKAWNLWRDNFLGLLLMFPIVSALIAAAHSFSAVAMKGSGSITAHAAAPVAGLTGHNFSQVINFAADSLGGWAGQAIGLAAWFYVYFLIPVAANASIGAVSTLIGRVNNPSKGIFDRMKKRRSDKLGDRLQKARNGQLTNNTNRFTKGVSSAASWMTDPKSNFLLAAKDVPGFRRSGLQTAHQLEHMRVEQSKKLMGELNSSMNDKSWRAVNGNLHKGLTAETRQRLEDAGMFGKTARTVGDYNKLEQILAQSSDQTERLAATNIDAVKGRLVTMGQDPEMGKASIEAASIMGLAQHGFHDRRDLAPTANSLMKEGGRGFAQTIVTQAQVLGAGSRPDMAAGYGLSFDESKGEYIDGLTENEGLRGYQAISRLKPSDFSNSKSGLYKPDKDGGSRDIIVTMLQTGNTEAAKKAQAKMENIEKLKNSADKAQRDNAAQQMEEMKKNGTLFDTQKLALAATNYEPLRRIMTQNATNFAYGGADIQASARKVLELAQIDYGSAQPPTDAEIAQQQQQVMAEEAARRAAQQQQEQEQQNQQNNGGH